MYVLFFFQENLSLNQNIGTITKSKRGKKIFSYDSHLNDEFVIFAKIGPSNICSLSRKGRQSNFWCDTNEVNNVLAFKRYRRFINIKLDPCLEEFESLPISKKRTVYYLLLQQLYFLKKNVCLYSSTNKALVISWNRRNVKRDFSMVRIGRF